DRDHPAVLRSRAWQRGAPAGDHPVPAQVLSRRARGPARRQRLRGGAPPRRLPRPAPGRGQRHPGGDLQAALSPCARVSTPARDVLVRRSYGPVTRLERLSWAMSTLGDSASVYTSSPVPIMPGVSLTTACL